MDELDLDSFIANIEQTAPEEVSGTKLVCKECGGRLEEEEDGNLACPVCYVQATNILQFDETELHHDEQGRPVYGQRVALADKRIKKEQDYGWSWSTDDAVTHILSVQLEALERAKLLSDLFRPAVTNMWLKFWLETIAPNIKDEYSDDDLMPISLSNVLKLRDVEVLFKVQDKIMIPLRSIRSTRDARRIYRMLGTELTRAHPPEVSTPDLTEDEECNHEEQLSPESSIASDVDPVERVSDQLIRDFNGLMTSDDSTTIIKMEQQPDEPQPTEASKENDVTVLLSDINSIVGLFTDQTQNLSKDSVKILTLNRTLAFIEATARCLPEDDPLFAADIIRACNQYLIPFYDSSKFLPENMKLNPRDKLMFQKTTLPTPVQLTRTASELISNIYKEQLPASLPAPDLKTILRRFIADLNLPEGLMSAFPGNLSFSYFPETRPSELVSQKKSRLPQYDRWAFAVLIYQLKALFNLGETYLKMQKLAAQATSNQVDVKGEFFIMSDWIAQVKLRLKMVLRHDPFVLNHPLCDLNNLEISPQLSRYIERQFESKPTTNIRSRQGELHFDTEFRNELVDGLKRELKPPRDVKLAMQTGDDLDPSQSVKYPMTYAFERAKNICADGIDSKMNSLLCKDFTSSNVVTLNHLPLWSINDNVFSTNGDISPRWPRAYRLLVDVGAFICFCHPDELISEIRLVEKYLLQTRIIRRKKNLNQTQDHQEHGQS